MSHTDELNQLTDEITSQMSHLSKCMIRVLSFYVFGMVMLQHCGQVRIAAFMSALLDERFANMKRRLRELTYESEAKSGSQRQTLDVTSCFAPLLAWIISRFEDNACQLVLAFDATHLRDRFTILSVSVVINGSAIPVAWHIRRSDTKGEWNPIWQELFATLHPAIPPDWTVFILSDSGLYSKTLFHDLSSRPNWHVFMRIESTQGFFQPCGTAQWQALRNLASPGMTPLICGGRCFKGNPITCTLIGQWDAVYDTPCLLVSDLPSAAIQHNVYCLRYWIECGFKDIKRGFFHWEQTKMQCPKRAERLWLVISIALLWLMLRGQTTLDDPAWESFYAEQSDTRILSVVLVGYIQFLVQILKGTPVRRGTLKPYRWIPLPDP